MAVTGLSGPLFVFGQSPYPGAEYNPDLAPSLFWGGVAIMDPRVAFTYLPGEAESETDFGFAGADNITTLAIVPYTKAVGAVVASANATSATLSLVSANSATTGVYITTTFTRSDTGVLDTGVGGAGLVALDAFSQVTGSITSGVLTVTANSAMPIYPGMVVTATSGTISAGSLTVPGPVYVLSQLTGGSGANGGVGTYQLSASALTATSGTVSLANPNCLTSVVPFGFSFASPSVGMWNPAALSSRVLGITAAASATATSATVTGYDIYGFPMVETISITAGSQTTGKKAWKYIRSVTLNAADATHAYSVDTTDVYGLPLRSDSFADITVNYAASLTALTGITAATSYTQRDLTSPATATTGDVRGTYGAFTSATGANKLVIRQSPQAQNLGSNVGLFGVAQYTTF